MIKIIDDVLSPKVFKRLHDSVFHVSFPWHFSPTAYGHAGGTWGLSNPILNSSLAIRVMSETIVDSILDNIGAEYKEIMSMRYETLTNQGFTIVNEHHVDIGVPHMVALMYLNDSDGDTIIYKEKMNPNHYKTPFTLEEYDMYLRDKLTEDRRVTPKANRVVLFDGATYHSSSTPTTVDRRITMNINFR